MGSSQTIRSGAEGEGPGDVDALALTPGELVGVAGAVSGPEAHQVEKLEHPVEDLLRCHLGVDPHRLADDAAYGVTGIQRRVRVLEDHLHTRSELAQLLLAEGRELDVAQPDLAGRRAMELQHSPPGRGLAAPALADQPERLAREEIEAHTIDRLDRHVDRLAREVLRHVHDPEHRLSRTAGRGHRLRPGDGLDRLSGSELSHVGAPPPRRRRNTRRVGRGSARTAAAPRLCSGRTHRGSEPRTSNGLARR